MLPLTWPFSHRHYLGRQYSGTCMCGTNLGVIPVLSVLLMKISGLSRARSRDLRLVAGF
jgi:hypothetical protein